MQAVGQFDEHHPDVVRHGQQHFAQAFGLAGLGTAEGQLADLGDAGHDMLNLGAESGFDFFRRGVGVFDHIVQQPGGDGDRIEIHIGQDAGNLQGMRKIGLAGQPHLSVMHPGTENIGPVDDVQVGFGVAVGGLVQNICDSNHSALIGFGPHHALVAGLTATNAVPFLLGILQGNTADGDVQIVLDLLFAAGSTAPVRQGETTVNFRFFG